MTNIFDTYSKFLKLRWPPDGCPLCPRCGSTKIYTLRTRATFKCVYCNKHFSATSGTIFAGHKLTFEQLVGFLEARDLNALQISQRMGVQYKVAWVMCAKLREMYARSGAIGDQTVARAKGYFQRGKTQVPACCDRCGKCATPLTSCTFHLDKKTAGYFCGGCREELLSAEGEFRTNFANIKIIKEFQEELSEYHKKHGRSADVSR